MKSMKYIFILIIISSSLCHIAAREKYEGCIYLSSEKNGDSINCTLHNETTDTVYLFYGYLKGAFSHIPEYSPEEINRYGEYDYLSPYLRRYNPYYKSFTITYRPYIPMLRLDDEPQFSWYFVFDGQCLQYRFIPFTLIGISPRSTLTFRLPYKLVGSRKFIEDVFSVDDTFDAAMTILNKIKNNRIPRYSNDTGRVNIEVAVYRHADIGQYVRQSSGHPGFYRPKNAGTEQHFNSEDKPNFSKFFRSKYYHSKGSYADCLLNSEAMVNALKKFIPVKLTILLSDSE